MSGAETAGGAQVYIVLSQPETRVGRLLGLFSRARFNHASLMLERESGVMYSFARLWNFFPLVGGFVVEDLRRPVLQKCAAKSPCLRLALPVTAAQRARIAAEVERFCRDRRRYHYDLLGLLPQKWGWERPRSRFFTCSQFVAYVLEQAGIALPRHCSVMMPDDFLTLGLREDCAGVLADILR